MMGMASGGGGTNSGNLDAIFGSTQGMILRRGASVWAAAVTDLWQVHLYPNAAELPATNPAAQSTRNAHPMLAYDDTTNEDAYWTFHMPDMYDANGMTVDIWFGATTATTGTAGFNVYVERIGDAVLDMDADSWDTATAGSATVPGTSGMATKLSVTVATAEMDGLAAGELGRLRLERNAAVGGDATGDVEVYMVVLRE